jgi:hypothetical protein
MKQLFVALLLLCVSSLAPAKAQANDEYKIESIGALTEAKVAEAIRGALSDKGMKIAGKGGKTVCEIWLRKEIPVTGGSVDGATFGQIPEGALIGVINFPANTSDFRGQGIKAGFYTLRFGLSLQDGAHLGVSPSRDFFLLANVAEDKDPRDITAAELVKLSRNASGAGHPSPWALTYPTTDEKAMPKVIVNDHEHVVLETKLKTKSGELAIGLVLIGKTEG